MEYQTRSVLIGRKKKTEGCDRCRSCFVSLFDVNDPHLQNIVPKQILDFEEIEKVVISSLDLDYYPLGNDLVVNNLESVKVEHEGNILKLTGKKRD